MEKCTGNGSKVPELYILVKFEVPTDATLNIRPTALWGVSSGTAVDTYRRFR